MKKILILLYPFCIIIGIWFIFSYPFFIKHKIPFPTTYQVNHFAPWDAYQKYWSPIKSEAYPDVVTQMYPWKYLTIQIEKSGHIALWNSYSFAGTPLLANFQSGALSPFNLLFFIFSFPTAWSMLVLLQPLLAGIFMYILMRELKIGITGSLISSVAFMFCGFITAWMPYGTLSMAAVFLPLILFAIHKNFEKPSVFYLVVMALGICFSVFSGHFQTSLYVLLFSFLFIMYCASDSRNRKKALIVLMAYIAGIFLSLPQVLPSVEFYLHAPRSNSFLVGGGIPFYYLITSFVPDFFGNPVTRNDILGNYAEWASFIGAVPFVLALFGMSLKRRRSTALFFTFTAIIFTILALASPLQNIIQSLKLPVLSTSNPPRIIILVSFSLAVLAGFGAQKLSDYMLEHKIKKILMVYGIVFGIIITAVVVLRVFNIEGGQVARHNSILPLIILLVSAVALLCVSVLKNKKMIPLVLVFLFILTSVDSLRFAQKWMVFDPRNLLYIDTPVVTQLQKEAGNDRVFGNLGTETVDYYGLRSLEGYDPLYSKRYGEFIAYANTADTHNLSRSVVQLNRGSKNTDEVLNLLDVKIFFEPRGDEGQSWAYPVWSRQQFKKIYEDDHFFLYKNADAVGHAKLFSSYKVLAENTILKTLFSKDFDYRNTLLLSTSPGLKIASDASGSAKVADFSANRVVIKTNTTGNMLLFLSDSYYPGWEAEIDGKLTKVIQADYSFRAVAVPAGKHTVAFVFRPKSFLYGVALAFLGALILFLSRIYIEKVGYLV